LIDDFGVIESRDYPEEDVKENFLPEEFENSYILVRQYSRDCLVKELDLIVRGELEIASLRLV